MVRLGCVPEQGGPSAYMENAKAVRTAPPGCQEQTDGLGKNGPETTAVRSNDSACRDQAVWSWTEGADDWREQAVRMLEQLKSSIRALCSIWRRRRTLVIWLPWLSRQGPAYICICPGNLWGAWAAAGRTSASAGLSWYLRPELCWQNRDRPGPWEHF